MDFNVVVKNLASITGAVKYLAGWYIPPDVWWADFKKPGETTQFVGVGSGYGYLYIDAYDGGSNRVANGAARGYISPGQGSTWEYDFATGILKEITAPPVADEYTLVVTVPTGNGYVMPGSGTYKSGTTVSIAARANSGYRFDHWGGDATGSTNPLSVVMNADKNIQAHFVASGVTPSPGTGQVAITSVTVDKVSVGRGGTVTVNLAAQVAEAFTGWWTADLLGPPSYTSVGSVVSSVSGGWPVGARTGSLTLSVLESNALGQNQLYVRIMNQAGEVLAEHRSYIAVEEAAAPEGDFLSNIMPMMMMVMMVGMIVPMMGRT